MVVFVWDVLDLCVRPVIGIVFLAGIGSFGWFSGAAMFLFGCAQAYNGGSQTYTP